MTEKEILTKTIWLIEKSGGNTLRVDSYACSFPWKGSVIHVIERSLLILDDFTPMVYFVSEENNNLRLVDEKEYQILISEYNKRF